MESGISASWETLKDTRKRKAYDVEYFKQTAIFKPNHTPNDILGYGSSTPAHPSSRAGYEGESVQRTREWETWVESQLVKIQETQERVLIIEEEIESLDAQDRVDLAREQRASSWFWRFGTWGDTISTEEKAQLERERLQRAAARRVKFARLAPAKKNLEAFYKELERREELESEREKRERERLDRERAAKEKAAQEKARQDRIEKEAQEKEKARQDQVKKEAQERARWKWELEERERERVFLQRAQKEAAQAQEKARLDRIEKEAQGKAAQREAWEREQLRAAQLAALLQKLCNHHDERYGVKGACFKCKESGDAYWECRGCGRIRCSQTCRGKQVEYGHMHQPVPVARRLRTPNASNFK
ncbi:hypothetical protein V501_01482 [Pseudogymnoascus sp. VKM F-4519 (FW-2642)]|nr:hypothetical protein V501_01482 [Pseudogymnoascus sp. VKM F-4519 (FW-2642)]